MKKIMSILLLATAVNCSAQLSASAKVGDKIGNAYNTDIVAYINHYAIPSYAVNGTSCIVAEDLRNFCFDVTWDNSTRSLTITRNKKTNPTMMNFKKIGTAGSKFADLLETDIKVYANGDQLTSYAINGYTMIPIEELTMFGNCYWVQEERAIKLWVDGVHTRSTKQPIQTDTPVTQNNTSTTTSSVYYPGTTIPTYTSVTGIALKKQETLDSGGKLYRYTFTDSSDVGDYWKALNSAGWKFWGENDESTSDVFESSLYKGSDLVLVNIYFDYNEVWVYFKF